MNPNHPVAKCHVALLARRFPKVLAAQFGYKVDNWDGSNPIHLPFSLGEISNQYLGSGLDQGLAHIYRLLFALNKKCNKPEMIEKKGERQYFDFLQWPFKTVLR